ncbi:MAG: branched-chain amino acid ABC transporter permease [Elusimicrobiota bacterium]
MIYFFQQALNAAQLGSVYALIALGYTMVYGVLSMINFAHGDFFMVGAFLCFVGVVVLHLSFIPVLLMAMAGVTMLGVATERVAYRPLRNAPKASAIITSLGVGIFLEHFTLGLSPYPKYIPPVLPSFSFNAGGVSVSIFQIATISISFILMLALYLVVNKTRVGLAMRAISADRGIVPLMGVPVDRIIALTFALGSGLGGAAGVMYAMAYPVIDPYIGIIIGWKAFISAVIGGIGNIRGAVLGAYILGTVEIMTAAFLPSTYRDLVAFSLLLILLIFRPHGLLGRAESQKV